MDIDKEFALIERWINYNVTAKVENANNLMSFGTMDPTGGHGRLPLTIKQFQNPCYSGWVTRDKPRIEIARV
jgi:hypothetical protein